ncbi:DUF6114 domain-containing protein [Streptomyces gobitricini]|uniref:Integral membrane protein n=1 Tax=Streptomyces gobitricini TaxID=68211 RepID=A0ABN3LJQ1_9ACTN
MRMSGVRAAYVAGWWRGRPWSAGTCMALAGVQIAYLPLQRPELLALQGVGATSSLLIAAALVGIGVMLVRRPQRAKRCGAAAVGLGLLSWPMANMGGFGIGMLLAVVGGAWALSWRHLPGERA